MSEPHHIPFTKIKSPSQ